MLMAGEEGEDRKEIRTYLFRNNIDQPFTESVVSSLDMHGRRLSLDTGGASNVAAVA